MIYIFAFLILSILFSKDILYAFWLKPDEFDTEMKQSLKIALFSGLFSIIIMPVYFRLAGDEFLSELIMIILMAMVIWILSYFAYLMLHALSVLRIKIGLGDQFALIINISFVLVFYLLLWKGFGFHLLLGHFITCSFLMTLIVTVFISVYYSYIKNKI